MQNKIIHIDWEGPLSVEAAKALQSGSDYGVYQVYGASPIYGNHALLYIGLAAAQTLGARIAQHGWMEWTRDPKNIEIYVGRLGGHQTPSNNDWERRIHMAERLLIFSHYPPYNTQKQLAKMEDDLIDVHVLNWKAHKDLLPEVSGARWTSMYNEIEDYNSFNTDHHVYSE